MIRLIDDNINYNDIKLDFNMNYYLLNKLYKNIDSNYNKRQRIEYLYFKLCMLLENDDIYPFSYQIDRNATKTYFAKNPNRLEMISVKNNKVSCFEFNEIMRKIFRIEGGIYRGVTEYGSPYHDVFYGILDKDQFEIDPIPFGKVSDFISIKINDGYSGIKIIGLNGENYEKEISSIYNDVQFEFKNRNKSKFSNKQLKDYIKFINSLNMSFYEKKLLMEFIININSINLKDFEFCSIIDRKYGMYLREKSFNNIVLKKVCKIENLENYGYQLILALKQKDNQMAYIVIGDVIELLDDLKLKERILNGKIVITKQNISSNINYKYDFIPGISEKIQMDSNNYVKTNILPLILKKNLELSIKGKAMVYKKKGKNNLG